MKKGIKIILNLLLISVLCFSIYKVCFKLYDYKKADITYSQINEIQKNKNTTNLDSYLKLKDLNSDYRFWINIENTNVDYPVVQTTDNSFYLKKDFYKKDSSSGAIFLDYRNNYKKDFNSLIYGHNMKNQTIFNDVENYKKEDFFKQNNKIKLSDDKSKYTYEVFSVYVADGTIGNNSHLSIINPSPDDKQAQDYLDAIKEKSLFKSELKVTPTDKIISLVTCSYERFDVRTIVHAKLIDIEEI